MKAYLLFLPALLNLAGGCAEDGTGILVELQSPLRPGSEIDSVDLKVFADGIEVYKETLDVGPAPFDAFPQTLLLLPGERTRSGPIVLQALGYLGFARVAFDQFETSFADGEVKTVTLILGPCRDFDQDDYGTGEACPAGEEDCDDEDALTHPGAAEVCDEKDNDCDGETDEGFDLTSDLDHCGRCDNACPQPENADASCDLGLCAFTCHDGYEPCGEACPDTRTDPAHCGGCDRACPDPPENAVVTCTAGICGWDCVESFTACGDACVDTQTDPLHCDGCNNACPPVLNATIVCDDGICDFDCDAGYERCSAACADTDTDPLHCGQCDFPCPVPDHADATCQDSTCGFACLMGYVRCGDTCFLEGTQPTFDVPGTYPTIQAAIDAACEGGLVEVAPGVYTEEIDILGKLLTVVATGGATQTRISGLDDNGVPVVSAVSGEPDGTTIDGFTIGGEPGDTHEDDIPDGAAGVLVDGSSLTLNDCHVVHNEGSTTSGFYQMAGGLCVTGSGSLMLEGGTVSYNISRAGIFSEMVGGIHVSGPGSSLVMRDVVLSGNLGIAGSNSTVAGGLIVESQGAVQADNSEFLLNQAQATSGNLYAGGGIFLEGVGSPSGFTACTLSGNLAEVGGMNNRGAGGVYARNAPLEGLADCDLVANTLQCTTECTGAGGAYMSSTGAQQMVRNRFLRNEAIVAGASYAAGGARLDGVMESVLVAQNLFAQNRVSSDSSSTRAAGGLMMYGTFSPVVVNNTFADNTFDGSETPALLGGGVLCNDLVSPVEFHSLIVFGNDGDSIQGDTCVPSYSALQGTHPPGGTGNIPDDPRFTDPGADDYTLQSSSPCIDMGHPDAAYDDPDGSPNDMGHTGGPDY